MITDRKTQEIAVGMGKIAFVGPGQVATTILGSCIGLTLFHPNRQVAAFAHIVLPESRGNASALAGKFADTAVPAMLAMFQQQKIVPHQLRAKLAGGATMFGGTGPLRIGLQNHAAVVERLRQCRIPITAEHIGGPKGRRVTVLPEHGQLKIEIVGEMPTIL